MGSIWEHARYFQQDYTLKQKSCSLVLLVLLDLQMKIVSFQV